MSDDDFTRPADETVGARASGASLPVECNGGGASLDEVLRTLADPQRRALLYHIRDARVASVDELARELLARERDVRPEALPDDRLEQMTAALVHAHLPRLADMQCVEYDERSRTVTYTDPPRLVDTVLEVLARLERTSGG